MNREARLHLFCEAITSWMTSHPAPVVYDGKQYAVLSLRANPMADQVAAGNDVLLELLDLKSDANAATLFLSTDVNSTYVRTLVGQTRWLHLYHLWLAV